MAAAAADAPKRPDRASFRITYWAYVNPSNVGVYSRNLARTLNWQCRHGQFRAVNETSPMSAAAAAVHMVAAGYQTDLLPLQVDALGVPIPPAAPSPGSGSGSACAAGLAEHQAVRDFCADICASLQDPSIMKFVFRPTSSEGSSRSRRENRREEVLPPPWTHIKMERTDVPVHDPHYYCVYYLPPASVSRPWCREEDGQLERPGMRAFRTLTEMAESCLASAPDYEPSFYKQKVSIHDLVSASVLRDFVRSGRRTKSLLEEICAGDGPNGIEVSETLRALSQAMQNIISLLSKKHDDHFRPSITYKLTQRLKFRVPQRHQARRDFEAHLSQVKQSMTAAAAPLRTVAMMARLSGPYGSFYGLTSLCPKECTQAEESAVLALMWGWHRGCDDVPALIPAGIDPIIVGRDSLKRASAHWHDAHETARGHLRELVRMWAMLEDGKSSNTSAVKVLGGWIGGRERRFGRREPMERTVEDSGLTTDGLMELLRTPPPPAPPPQSGKTGDATRRRGRNKRRRGRVYGTYNQNGTYAHNGTGLTGIREDQWMASSGGRPRVVDLTMGRFKSGGPLFTRDHGMAGF